MDETPAPPPIAIGFLDELLADLQDTGGNSIATREALIRYLRNGVTKDLQVGWLLKWLISWPNERESVFKKIGAGMKFLEILKSLPVQELGFGQFVAVSRLCFGAENLPILYGVRESPESEMLTGWRFSSGRESPEFAADPKNYKLVPLKILAERDDSLSNLQDLPIGSEVARREAFEAWQLMDRGDTAQQGHHRII